MNNKKSETNNILKSKRTALSTFIFLTIACNGSAIANQLPGTGISDIINNIDSRSIDRGSKLDLTTPKELFGDLKSIKIDDSEKPTGEKVSVKTFIFDGSSVFENSVLAERIKKYENSELTLSEIKDAAREITKLYRESGYFVARAYIPAQEAEGGVIKISILEGVIGNVTLDNNSGVKDDVIIAYTKGIDNARIVLSNELERKALLVNELSGVKDIKINALAGANLGESDLSIKVIKDEKYKGQVSVDNYGSKYAGKHRLSTVFDFNNVSGVGDQFTLAALVSENANSKSFSANYMRPVGFDGWKVGGSVYNSDYELSKLGDLISYGESTGVSAWASYPLVKTQEWSSEIKFGGYSQVMSDSIGIDVFSEKAKKQNNSLNLEFSNNLSTSFFNSPGRLYNSVSISGGKLSNKNDISKEQDTFAKTTGSWSKIEMFTIHRQRLSQDFSLQTSLNIQENLGRNLDGTEKISLSGVNGVRSYLSSELNADSGYVASFDLIYNIYNDGNYMHNASVFIDRAEGKKQRKRVDNGLPNYRAINAAGIGYRFELNEKLDIDATFARGFGSNSAPQVQSEFSKSKNRFFIKATVKF